MSTIIIILLHFEFDYIFTFASEFYTFIRFALFISVLPFHLEDLPLAFLVRQFLWWWTLSTFFCLKMSLSFLYFQRTTFLSKVFLVGSFSLNLSALWIYHPTLFLPWRFLLRNLLIALWGFPCMWWVLFLALFKILSLIFDTFILMCLREVFFRSTHWGPLSFMCLAFHVFPQVWEVFSHFFHFKNIFKICFTCTKQHIDQTFTHSDNPTKATTHLTPYIATTISLTIFPVLHYI